MRARDTTAAAAEMQHGIYRRMTAGERFAIALELSEATRQITLDGIRARHPSYDDEQARLALFRLIYGDELFAKAWPRAPLLAP